MALNHLRAGVLNGDLRRRHVMRGLRRRALHFVHLARQRGRRALHQRGQGVAARLGLPAGRSARAAFAAGAMALDHRRCLALHAAAGRAGAAFAMLGVPLKDIGLWLRLALHAAGRAAAIVRVRRRQGLALQRAFILRHVALHIAFALFRLALGALRGAALLHHVRQFMREEALAAGAARVVLAVVEEQVAAARERLGADGAVERSGMRTRVHAHITEVGADAGFHL